MSDHRAACFEMRASESVSMQREHEERVVNYEEQGSGYITDNS